MHMVWFMRDYLHSLLAGCFRPERPAPGEGTQGPYLFLCPSFSVWLPLDRADFDDLNGADRDDVTIAAPPLAQPSTRSPSWVHAGYVGPFSSQWFLRGWGVR